MKEEQFKDFLKDQCEEMKKYKWIRSEQEHHDLGNEAIQEWIIKFAKDFRKFWESTH